MLRNDNGNAAVLPIVIAAHNEEKVIERSICSALEQKTPDDVVTQIIIVANGCEDRTEEIVRNLQNDQVTLLSMTDKGKTKAINHFIEWFDNIPQKDSRPSYAVFLDADCQFVGDENILRIYDRFASNEKLCAVGAECVPDVVHNSREDLVSKIYRSLHELDSYFDRNSISGMCYAIRFDILKKIDFPDFQFAEDMYVSTRLSGHFIKDRSVKIMFGVPGDLSSELQRRTRQEVSTQRFIAYREHVKKHANAVKLFEEPLADEYRYRGMGGDSKLPAFLKLRGIAKKFYLGYFIVVVLIARWRARRIMQSMKEHDLDYWKVIR